MSLYADLSDTVARLLQQYGRTMTLTRPATQTYNAATGGTTGGAADTYSVYGAVFDYAQSEIDGSLIRQGDRRIYLQAAGLTVTPQTGDTVTAGAKTYSVVASRPLDPAGTAVLHEVQARGVGS